MIGGGAAGNAVTILLRRAGLTVDLVEAKDDWNATAGSGITPPGQRPARPARTRRLGTGEGIRLRLRFRRHHRPRRHRPAHTQEGLRTGGDDLPRDRRHAAPRLQRILIEAVRDSGARRSAWAPPPRSSARAPTVSASGSPTAPSTVTTWWWPPTASAPATRAAIGITAKPEPTGMAIWRVAAPRPVGVTRTDLAYGGPASSPATAPPARPRCTRTSSRPTGTAPPYRPGRTPTRCAGWPPRTAATGRDHRDITHPAKVNYTWFDRLLVEGSWHRGRVVLVGDAALLPAHPRAGRRPVPGGRLGARATAERLRRLGRRTVPGVLRSRRVARVRPVVEASVQIGRWQAGRVQDADVPGLMAGTMTMLREPPRPAHHRRARTRPAPPVESLVTGLPGHAEAKELDARRNGPAALAVSGPMVRERVPRLTDAAVRLAAMDAQGVDVQLVSPRRRTTTTGPDGVSAEKLQPGSPTEATAAHCAKAPGPAARARPRTAPAPAPMVRVPRPPLEQGLAGGGRSPVTRPGGA